VPKPPWLPIIMSRINKIKAKEILDSRGKPTVEVELRTNKGVFRASVPSGASTGKNEAIALDVKKAIDNINNIIGPKLLKENELDQERIDKIIIDLDGTKNKSKLGANAILPVSIAVCRAAAAAKGISLYKHINQCHENRSRDIRLPRPCFNIINGGAHANNNLEIQEFMIIPQEKSFAKNLKVGKTVFKKLKVILKKNFGRKGVVMGDEGGFSPPIFNDIESLDFIIKAISGYNVEIGLDCAASQFYSKGKYRIDDKGFNRDALLEFYKDIVKKYPIIFIEDPFFEKDVKGFSEITKELGEKINIIGDDLLVTNIKKIKQAKNKKACNGAIIKPNQIGTVTETLEAVRLVKSYKWKVIVSHRSGETLDDFIADLAVGVGAGFIKSGGPTKHERLVKYNRLLKIENQLNNLTI